MNLTSTAATSSTTDVLRVGAAQVDAPLRAAVAQLPASLSIGAGFHFGFWDAAGTPIAVPQGKMVRPAFVLAAARAVNQVSGSTLSWKRSVVAALKSEELPVTRMVLVMCSIRVSLVPDGQPSAVHDRPMDLVGEGDGVVGDPNVGSTAGVLDLCNGAGPVFAGARPRCELPELAGHGQVNPVK